jgi:hypothetical protein
MRDNTESLKLLYLYLEQQIWCYNKYFFNKYVFHTKDYGESKNIYNSEICVKRSIFNKIKIKYYDKLK